MHKNKYEKLIYIISKSYGEAEQVNEAVTLLIQIELTDIKKEHYKILEDFILFCIVDTEITETNENLLNKLLNSIRTENI